MAKRLILLFITVSFIVIGMVFYIFHNKANHKLVSGGSATHMYHSEGLITELSNDPEIITVELKTIEGNGFSFDSDTVYLNYSHVQHIDNIDVNDTIKFYFFKWDVENTNIKVQYVYKEK